ncbi:hypothetical protein C7475_11911 [Chitinophaga sp. S165]|nr:hypothetical protein C7475_11911 [Chitinophaga sp. S165]
MKLILLLLLLVSADKFQTNKVYICKSSTSYAYHNRLCHGLKSVPIVLMLLPYVKPWLPGIRNRAGIAMEGRRVVDFAILKIQGRKL